MTEAYDTSASAARRTAGRAKRRLRDEAHLEARRVALLQGLTVEEVGMEKRVGSLFALDEHRADELALDPIEQDARSAIARRALRDARVGLRDALVRLKGEGDHERHDEHGDEHLEKREAVRAARSHGEVPPVLGTRRRRGLRVLLPELFEPTGVGRSGHEQDERIGALGLGVGREDAHLDQAQRRAFSPGAPGVRVCPDMAKSGEGGALPG